MPKSNIRVVEKTIWQCPHLISRKPFSLPHNIHQKGIMAKTI